MAEAITSDPRLLRVMTWNIWWHFGEDWRDRQRALRSAIAELDPDLLGLQEVWSNQTDHQADELGRAFGMHAAHAAPSLPPPPPAATGQEVGVALLSRWPIERTEVHRLPSGHRDHVVALVTEVRHPDGPLHSVVTCADYDEGGGAHRLAQTRAVAALATDPARDGPLPVLAMGDLNAPPESPEIRAIAETMTDAWVAAGSSGASGITLRSDNPNRPEGAWQLDRRIDYVFVRPGRTSRPIDVVAARAVDEPRNGVHPSDHAAVVVDIAYEVA